jgi:large subunit ribosomal protein L21
MKQAIIVTGGKQYIVKEGEYLNVDSTGLETEATLELPLLATFDEEKGEFTLSKKASVAKAVVLENMRGDKVRVSKFKSKVRYNKTRGYRHELSQIKILSF